MSRILTEYKVKCPISGNFSTFGSSFDENNTNITKRGLNETIVGVSSDNRPPQLPSWYLRHEKPNEAFHAACYLCMIGMKADYLNIDEVLGDFGLIHQFSHYYEGITSLIELIQTCLVIEDKVWELW